MLRRTNYLAKKIRAFMELNEAESRYLDSLLEHAQDVVQETEIISQGEKSLECFVLLEGWAYRHKHLADGRRQVLGFLLPGDFVGLNEAMMGTSEVSVTTLTPSSVASFAMEKYLGLCKEFPRLGVAVTWTTAQEHAMLLERLVSLGRRSAYERLSHILLETFHRLRLLGLAEGRSFDTPLTQELLADALGLTSVHVSRTFKRLSAEALVAMDRGKIIIPDVDSLARAVKFDSEYLVRDGEPYDAGDTPVIYDVRPR